MTCVCKCMEVAYVTEGNLEKLCQVIGVIHYIIHPWCSGVLGLDLTCLGWGCLLLELVREERRTWSTLTSSNTGAVSSVCIWEGEGWCCRKTTAVNGEPGSVSLNIPNLKKSVCCLQKLKCYVFCQSGVKFLLAPRSKSAFLNWMTSKETHINTYEYSGMLYNMIKASIYRLFTKCGFNIKF